MEHFYVKKITNVATGRNFEVICDKYNVMVIRTSEHFFT